MVGGDGDEDAVAVSHHNAFACREYARVLYDSSARTRVTNPGEAMTPRPGARDAEVGQVGLWPGLVAGQRSWPGGSIPPVACRAREPCAKTPAAAIVMSGGENPGHPSPGARDAARVLVAAD